METVSVVIVTYKRNYSIVRNAILSVLAQSYDSLEIVVVDDNDEQSVSGEIERGLHEFDGRVKYICYKGNRGACFARNYGAENTSGKYIAFLDDDDVWYPNKIERQVNFLNSENCDLVGCDACHVTIAKDGSYIKRVEKKRYDHSIVDYQDLLSRNIPGGCSYPLMLRESFNKAGRFKEQLPASQDYDLWLRIGLIGKIGHINECLLDYNIYLFDRISGNVQKKITSYNYLIENYSCYAKDKALFISEKYVALSRLCFDKLQMKLGFKYAFLSVIKKCSISTIKRMIITIGFGLKRRVVDQKRCRNIE